MVIRVHEGGGRCRPQLECEPPRLRRALLRAMRSPEEAHGSRESILRSQDPAAAEAAEAALQEAILATLGGGVRERWRTFELVGEMPAATTPMLQTGSGEEDGGMVIAGGAPEEAKATLCAAGAAKRHGAGEPLAEAIAACKQPPPQAPPPQAQQQPASANAADLLAAMPAQARSTYRQSRRWGDDMWGHLRLVAPPPGAANGSGGGGGGGGATLVEVVELKPEHGAPLLRDAHLDMLREVLGSAAMAAAAGGVDEEEEEEDTQPWGVYREVLGDAREVEGWEATAEVFSLDAPLLLAFAAEAEAHASMLAALTAEEQDEEYEDDDEAAEIGDDEMMLGARMSLSGYAPHPIGLPGRSPGPHNRMRTSE